MNKIQPYFDIEMTDLAFENYSNSDIYIYAQEDGLFLIGNPKDYFCKDQTVADVNIFFEELSELEIEQDEFE